MMKQWMHMVALALLVCGTLAQGHAQSDIEIGGEKVVTLTRTPTSSTKPEFTSVTVLPGRGMEVLQITANFPSKGNVNVLVSPSVAEAKQTLDGKDTDFGALGYSMGSAFLIPYPNRIRGTLSADGKTITTTWQGHPLTLPANSSGSLPTAERHAMHGLILKDQAEDVKVTSVPDGQKITATIHAGDFGGHWLSKTDLMFTITLTADAVDTNVVARNVGTDAEPIAIGWHPYFTLPSGDRTQVRVHIPGKQYAHVDNYDNVFPSGELSPVAGTQYDLRAEDGAALGSHFYDDNWSTLDWKDGAAVVKIIDPAAQYGVAIEGVSPTIKTIQMYAPTTKQFVAIEHQFNFGDPFGKEWKDMDTGMVTLKPKQSTRWHVRIRVFQP